VEVTVIVKSASVAFNGRNVPGIELDCDRCGKCVKVAGETIRSYRRGYALFAEGCPRNERNFYRSDDEPEDK